MNVTALLGSSAVSAGPARHGGRRWSICVKIDQQDVDERQAYELPQDLQQAGVTNQRYIPKMYL